jgi:hypothetical protein
MALVTPGNLLNCASIFSQFLVDLLQLPVVETGGIVDRNEPVNYMDIIMPYFIREIGPL